MQHDIDLSYLEQRVEHLLQALEKLRAENQFLRHEFVRHAREKNLWRQNNQQLVNKIKQIISRLQEMT